MIKRKVSKLIQKSTIIFSHNDLDGLGCILLGILTFNKCKYRLNTYGNIDNKIKQFLEDDAVNTTKSFDYLYITDISISDETVELLNNSPYKDCWFLLDHHDTRKDLHNGTNMFVLPEDENGNPNSGTNLFKEFLIDVFGVEFNMTTDIFVDMVRLWDTWLWKEQDIQTPVDLDILRKSIDNLGFIRNMLPKLEYDSFNLLTSDDMAIVKKCRDDLEYYYNNTKNITLKDSNDNVVSYIIAEDYTSLLADIFLTRNPEVDYLVILNLRRGVGSIRTQRNDIHVGELASHIILEDGKTGGGHPKASGFPITDELYSAILTDGINEVHSLLISKKSA